VHALRSFHGVWGYVAIVANGLVGIAALIAWRVRRIRGRWVTWATVVAESMMMLQVLVGVILLSSKQYTAPRFHVFYGILAFITVGFAYSYRRQMRGRRELYFGLIGLFLMGVGIRAVLQVTGS
jgi:hypothetical protein